MIKRHRWRLAAWVQCIRHQPGDAPHLRRYPPLTLCKVCCSPAVLAARPERHPLTRTQCLANEVPRPPLQMLIGPSLGQCLHRKNVGVFDDRQHPGKRCSLFLYGQVTSSPIAAWPLRHCRHSRPRLPTYSPHRRHAPWHRPVVRLGAVVPAVGGLARLGLR